MYIVLGSPKTRAARVLWALEELGQPYEVKPVYPHSPEVAAANASGKVPVLLDGDLAVTDSAAILFHLADKHGALIPPVGDPARTRLTSMMFFAADALESPLWSMAKHGFILPEDLRRQAEIEPAARHEFARAVEALAKDLGDGPYILGDQFSIADILIGHIGGWAKGAGFEIPEGPVADYMARVRGRPAWKAVIARRENA